MELTAQQFNDVLTSLRKADRVRAAAESRRYGRLEVQARLAVALIDDPDAKGYSALACDISVGGIGLNQSTAAVGGGRLLVRLPSGDKSTVAIVCSVAYCKALADGIFSVGVEFLEEVDPASARSIAWPDAPK